ncbi:MbcA/ParS/Xre antitoxin family protein [soil metagenome]
MAATSPKTASPRPRARPTARLQAPATANLVLRYMDASGGIDFDGITTGFGISKTQLAETAGLGRDVLQKAARRRAAKTQTRIREMLEIVARIEAWSGGQTQAMAWYRSQPIAALDGRTAEALVKTGKAGAVRDYLDHIALGGFA